jgi:CheY-like chemotaxis protein
MAKRTTIGRISPTRKAPDRRGVDLPSDSGEEMELVDLADTLSWIAQQEPATPESATPADPALEPIALDDEARPARRALVADDDPEMRRLVREILTAMDCEVIEAGDGAAALEAARRERPALAVVDAVLPRMHGFDLCQAIRSDPALAGMRVLLCSAAYPGAAMEDARARFGADAAVEKPFRLDDLRRALAALLGAGAGAAADAARAEPWWRAAADALAAGRVDDALRAARAAVAADPACADAHYYLAHALARSGAGFEALAAFERAAALRPDLPVVHECLAKHCEELGFPRAARVAWMHAAEACADPALRRAYEAQLLRLLGSR